MFPWIPVAGEPCPSCNGTRVCWVCGGTGTHGDHPCGNCYGTGQCQKCAGTGVVNLQRSEDRVQSPKPNAALKQAKRLHLETVEVR